MLSCRPDLRRHDRARHLAAERARHRLERDGRRRRGAARGRRHAVRHPGRLGHRLERDGAFVAIIVISLLLDEAGFFEWAALHVARWGRGHGRRLFVLIVLLGAAVSALFANDGAALILTPIVIAMLRALGFKDKATLAFVMAAGFIADTASLPLVVSNLVNIVSADFFDIGFARYAAVMVPVDLVSIAATLGALLLFFRRDIPADYDVAQLRAPREAIRDRATFRAGWIVLALLLVGFFLLDPLGVPVSAVAAAGAILLLAIAGRGHVIQTAQGAARRAVAGRDLLARHVPGRLRPAERGPDRSSRRAARSHRSGRRLGRGVRAPASSRPSCRR